LYKALCKLGACPGIYIPDRFSEGYGLNENAVRKIAETGYSLMITVDTGISAKKEVSIANQLGLDVIVTDHHEPPEEIPEAFAVINPKQRDGSYPTPFLAGVGVTLKLIQALTEEEPSSENLAIAALGTIADIVPLRGENRLIAYKGLKALAETENPGIRAMLKVAGLEGKELVSDHVGFILGPCLNAAGRLDHAKHGVLTLLEKDLEKAKIRAKKLDDLNKERQDIVEKIFNKALQQAYENKSEFAIVVAGEDWHEGVIGIVASRLVEHFYRPAIVLSINPKTGIAKGSARSIEKFNLYQGLTECKDLLLKYGGHEMAAGMSLLKENINIFREKMNQVASQIPEEDLWPKLHIDLSLNINQINLELLEEIQKLAPFGTGNPEPLFAIQNTDIYDIKRVGTGDHIKFRFDQMGNSLDGIAFRWGDKIETLPVFDPVDVVGKLVINEWNGLKRPQILVEDIKTS
jgi:single-stranded-DNA-specific exonuclease